MHSDDSDYEDSGGIEGHDSKKRGQTRFMQRKAPDSHLLAACSHLQKEKDNLNDQIGRLKNDKDDLQMRLEEEMKKNRQTTEDLRFSQTREHELIDKYKRTMTKFNDLKESLQRTNAKLKQTGDEKRQFETEHVRIVGQFETRLKEEEKRTTAMAELQRSTENRVESEISKNKDNEAHIALLIQENEQAEEEKVILAKQYEARMNEIINATKKDINRAQKATKRVKEGADKAIQDTEARASAEIDRVRHEIQKAVSDATSMRNRLATVAQEKKSVILASNDMEFKLVELQAKLEVSDRENAELQRKLDAARRSEEQATGTIWMIEQKRDGLQTELARKTSELANQKNGFTREIDVLTRTIQANMSEHAADKARICDMKSEIRDMKTRLEAAEKHPNEEVQGKYECLLTEQVSELRGTVARLEAETSQRLSGFVEETFIAKEKRTRKKVEAELVRTREVLAQKESLINMMTSENVGLESALQSAKKHVSACKDKIEDQARKYDTLVSEQKTKVTRLEYENKELRENLHKLTDENTNRDAEIADNGEKAQEMWNEVERLKDVNFSLQRDGESLATENVRMSECIRSATLTHQTLEREYLELESAKEIMALELSKAESARVEGEQEIQSLASENAEQGRSISMLMSANKELSERCRDLERLGQVQYRKIKARKTDVKSLKRRNERLLNELKDVRAENTTLKDQGHEAQKAIERLGTRLDDVVEEKQTVDSLKAQRDDELQKTQERNQMLQLELRSAQEEKTRVKSELGGVTSELKRLSDDLNSERRELVEQQGNVSTLTAKVSALSVTNTKLTDKVQTQKGEIRRLRSEIEGERVRRDELISQIDLNVDHVKEKEALSRSLASVTREKHAFERDMAEEKDKRKSVEELLEKMQDDMTRLSNEKDDAVAKMAKQVKRLERNVHARNAKIRDYAADKERVEAEMMHLTDQVSMVQENNSSMMMEQNHKIRGLSRVNTENDEMIMQIREELVAAKSLVSQLRAEVRSLNSRNEEEHMKTEELESAIDDLRQQLKQYMKCDKQKTEEIARLETANARTMEDFAQKQTLLEKMRKQLEAEKGLALDKVRRLKEKKRAVTEASQRRNEQTKEEMTSELTCSVETAASLEKEISVIRSECDGEKRLLAEKIASQRKEIQRLRGENAFLVSQKRSTDESSEREKRDLHNRINTVTAESKAELARYSNEATKKTTRLERELGQARESNDALQEQIVSIKRQMETGALKSSRIIEELRQTTEELAVLKIESAHSDKKIKKLRSVNRELRRRFKPIHELSEQLEVSRLNNEHLLSRMKRTGTCV